jgi:hypothetical protein
MLGAIATVVAAATTITFALFVWRLVLNLFHELSQ